MLANCQEPSCGKQFQATRASAKFCCSVCRSKSYRRRKEAEKQARRYTIPTDMYPEIRQLESISKPSVRAIKALLHGYGQEAAWIGIVIAQEIATDLGVTFSKTANDKQ